MSTIGNNVYAKETDRKSRDFDDPKRIFRNKTTENFAQSFFSALKDLLAPKRPPLPPRKYVPPLLPEKYSYDDLSSYMVNHLGHKQNHLGARLIHPIALSELEMFCKISSRKMCEILQMTDYARNWIKEHKAEHRKVGAGRFVRIKHKLEYSEKLLSKLVQKLPLSLPREGRYPIYNLNALKPPGLKNVGNDCFMNALLQGIFGDPVTYKHIAIHDDQLDRIKFHAYNFRKAFSKAYFRPLLNISQDIRTLFPET